MQNVLKRCKWHVTAHVNECVSNLLCLGYVAWDKRPSWPHYTNTQQARVHQIGGHVSQKTPSECCATHTGNLSILILPYSRHIMVSALEGFHCSYIS